MGLDSPGWFLRNHRIAFCLLRRLTGVMYLVWTEPTSACSPASTTAASASTIIISVELRRLRSPAFLPKVICVAYETDRSAYTIRRLETGLEAQTIRRRSQVFS